MKPLIIALDVDTEKEAVDIIKATKKYCDVYKVGPTHVLKYGPSLFKKIKKLKKKIFLDLKFHDIPNTMKRSIEEAAKNNIYSATIHTSAAGPAMKMVSKIKKKPLLWGVTVLTSLSHSDLKEVGFKRKPKDQVLRLAKLAKQSKLDGVVASAEETAKLRKQLGRKFQIITPGIRMPGDAIGDQKRIATPATARKAGATFIVVGRPIIKAKNPGEAAKLILKNWGSSPK